MKHFLYKYLRLFYKYSTTGTNKRVRNLAVSKEPWDISEVIRDKHGVNIPGLGPQKKYSLRATSAAEKACLSRMTPNWRMRKWNTELAYCNKLLHKHNYTPELNLQCSSLVTKHTNQYKLLKNILIKQQLNV